MNNNERTICKSCGYRRISWDSMLDKNVCPKCQQKYSVVNDDSKYIPNKIPLKDRIISVLMAIVIFCYCVYSLQVGEIRLPFSTNQHFPHQRVILENFSSLSFIPAILSAFMAIALCLLVVIDHYDKRHNEYQYKKMTASVSLLMKLFFLLALFIKYSEKLYG